MILDMLLEKRDLDKTNVPSGWWAGGKAASGVVVSADTALTADAWWRGIDLISGGVAKIPLDVYRRGDANSREVDRNHPASPLVRSQANPYLKAFDFKRTIQANVIQHGNGYAGIDRDGVGNPTALIWADPHLSYPVLELDQETNRSRVLYALTFRTSDLGTRLRIVEAPDVLHIRGFGLDGLEGYSLLRYAREALGLSIAMRQYSSLFFSRGAMPGVIIKVPRKLTPEQQQDLRESYNRMHQGLSGAHNTMIAQLGMEVEPLSQTAKDSQMTELQGLTVRQIANFLGVPPHKLGDDARVSYNSLEQEEQSYLADALDPWLHQWEAECNAKLLSSTERERESHFFEFRREAVIRLDAATQIKTIIDQLNNGMLSLNESRAIMNRPAYPEDEIRRPANIIVDTEAEGEEGTEDGNSAVPDRAVVRSALRECLVGTVERIAKIFGTAIKRRKAADRLQEWLEDDETNHAGKLAEAIGPIVRGMAGLYGIEPQYVIDAACTAWRRAILEDPSPAMMQARLPDIIATTIEELIDGKTDAAAA